jgi:ubiquinone/menaquinone biosynthesis C-methylase UbiE
MNSYEDTWDKVVRDPPIAFKELFQTEKEYLRVNVKKGSKVLDIACGNGRNMISLVDIAGNITGLDNSQKAVDDANENLKSFRNVHVIIGDAFQLPFEDKSFDIVLLSMTLVNFFEDKLTALKEMNRVLKDGGKVFVSVYSENALAERLLMYKSVGLKIVYQKEGYIEFDNGVTSEQFSKNKFEVLANEAGLKVTNCKEVGDLAYIFSLGR